MKCPRCEREKEIPALRIIDQKTWDTVQANKAQSKKLYKEGLSSPREVARLLSPIIACGVCHGSMFLRRGKQRTGRENPGYVCTRNSTKGAKRGCSNGHRLPQELAERAVTEAVENELMADGGLAILAIAGKELDRAKRNVDDRASIEANILDTEAEIANGTKALMRGYSPAIEKAVRAREADLAHLRKELESLPVLADVDHDVVGKELHKRLRDWKGYLRGNPAGLTQSVLKKIFPERIRFTPGDKGVWTFEGVADVHRILDGLVKLPPRAPRGPAPEDDPYLQLLPRPQGPKPVKGTLPVPGRTRPSSNW